MTVRAVVLPGTPLLVPGAAGGALVLGAAREAAVSALAGLLTGTDEVVVVARGTAPTRGPARASLAAFGIADGWLDPVWGRATGHAGLRTAGPTASVALLALAGAGRTAPVEVIELDDATPTTACGEVGVGLARRGVRLVVGHDPRSAAADTVLAGFVDPGWQVRTHRSTGEHEGRAYEVRSYADRTSTRSGGPAAVSR